MATRSISGHVADGIPRFMVSARETLHVQVRMIDKSMALVSGPERWVMAAEAAEIDSG